MSGVYDINRATNGIYESVFLDNGIAAVEAADSAALAGGTVATGTLALTDGDTAALAGANIVTGYFGETVPISGYHIVVEAADSISAGGYNVVGGTIAIADAADTASLGAFIVPVGTLSFIEAADSTQAEAISNEREVRDTCVIAGTANPHGLWTIATRGSDAWTRRNVGGTVWTRI